MPPALDFGSEIDIASTSTPGQINAGGLTTRLVHAHCTTAGAKREANNINGRSRKRKADLNHSVDATESMIESLSQNILCDDYYNLLESELPRWTTEGLWKVTQQNVTEPRPAATTTSTSYEKLERAYHAVCQLSSRMNDDVVRNRFALIQLHLVYTETHEERRNSLPSTRSSSTVGRGDASAVIDLILENIHEGWTTLDHRRQTALRAKFHERKKCGKRWSQLAQALGPGILLTCSAKLANAV